MMTEEEALRMRLKSIIDGGLMRKLELYDWLYLRALRPGAKKVPKDAADRDEACRTEHAALESEIATMTAAGLPAFFDKLRAGDWMLPTLRLSDLLPDSE